MSIRCSETEFLNLRGIFTNFARNLATFFRLKIVDSLCPIWIVFETWHFRLLFMATYRASHFSFRSSPGLSLPALKKFSHCSHRAPHYRVLHIPLRSDHIIANIQAWSDLTRNFEVKLSFTKYWKKKLSLISCRDFYILLSTYL